ncbi:phosphotransferase [Komagataeibacter rhaeticus]|nr:phosphotransferase [Komagataeibacter rhaeticus]
MAHASFGTSLLARPFEDVFTARRLFSANLALTRITLDLVLDDPYRDHPRNHWHDPALTPIVLDIRSSAATLLAVENLRRRFLSQPQALLHGDLHTGSIMSTADDTRVIDGEFAVHGPIGFDCGMFVGNLVLHYFATPDSAARQATLHDIAAFWHSFHEEFLTLWTGHETPPPGTLRPLAYGPAARVARQRFMNEIMADTIGFAGWKSSAASSATPIRRISTSLPIPASARPAARARWALPIMCSNIWTRSARWPISSAIWPNRAGQGCTSPASPRHPRA